ncbi:MAG TPA: tetratricopeptide repeat protein [Polyangiaceae bacterium]|jgi:hypothetical protein
MRTNFRGRTLRSLLFASFTALLAASAHAAGVTPSDATPVQREEAQAHFARAHDLYENKKYDEAAAEFAKSYAVVTSPNALLFLARCDRERGKLVAAYVEFGRTGAEAKEHAAEDPRYAKTAQAASDERDALAQQLGFVTITVEGGAADAAILVGGERFPRGSLGEPLPVMPGNVDLSVESAGRAPVRRSVTVAAGERKAVKLDAGPAEAPREGSPSTPAPLATPAPAETPASSSPARGLAYGAAAVGVAGFATFAIAGVMSNGTYSDLQSKCGGGRCPSNQGYEDEVSRGSTQQTIANVGLVVGAVGVAAAVTLFVISLPSGAHQATAFVGPGSLGVKGVF